MTARRAWSLLLPVLGLAFALRVIFLDRRPIAYDDAFSFFLAQRSLPEIVSGTAADTMPPLYYFLLHYWMQLGAGVGWLRLLNVILSLGTVAVSFALLRRLADGRVAAWGALLVAISPIQIFQAQELRMYALLCLSLLAHLLCLLDYLERGALGPGRKLSWIGAVAFGTMAMYTHNLAIFSLAAGPIAWLCARRWDELKRTLLAVLAILVLSLPWLLILPKQIAKIESAFWTPRPGLLEIIQAIIQTHAALPLPQAMLPVALSCGMVALVIVVYESARSREEKKGKLVLGCAALAPAGLLFAASYLMRPVFVPRSFMFSMVAYLGLAAMVIAKGRSLLFRVGTLLAFLLAAGISLPYQYAYEEFPRSPYREAGESLQQKLRPGDVVIHDNKLSYFPMAFYAPELPQSFLADEPGSPNDTLAPQTQQAMDIYPASSLEEGVAGATRVWFVVFDRAIDNYRQLGLPDHPRLEWLRQHFRAGARESFNDLQVLEFAR